MHSHTALLAKHFQPSEAGGIFRGGAPVSKCSLQLLILADTLQRKAAPACSSRYPFAVFDAYVFRAQWLGIAYFHSFTYQIHHSLHHFTKLLMSEDYAKTIHDSQKISCTNM